MKQRYLYMLIAWIVVVSVGMAQIVFDSGTTEYSIIGYGTLVGIPVMIYMLYRHKTTLK